MAPMVNDDDQGWTPVKPRKWAKGSRSADKADNPAGNPAGNPAVNLAAPGPKPTSVQPAVVARLREEFASVQQELDTFFSQGELRGIFAAYVAAHYHSGNGPVEEIVCFGIGCFDHPTGSWQAKRTSYCQLAALLLITEELEKTLSICDDKFKIIFQEPAFNLNDIAFIKSLGHIVVDVPKGLEHINANTLFYGPHLYYQHYAEALQGELPVIYVGSGIDCWELNTHLLPRNHTVTMAPLKKIFKEYQRFQFPEVKGGVIFHKTYICLRPSAQQEEDELCLKLSEL